MHDEPAGNGRFWHRDFQTVKQPRVNRMKTGCHPAASTGYNPISATI